MRKLFQINFNSTFFGVNLLILIYLLSNGENAPLFNLDFSDWYLDKSQRLATDFKQLRIPGIDYSSFNGWNTTHGSIPINHIMVFLNLFFTPHSAAQIFIFLTDLLTYFGFFFILKRYFKINPNLSSLLTLLIFLLLISVNENYIVNQYTLFGFLILTNFLLTEKNKNFYLGLVFLVIYCSFSYPPYNVPIAPFFHLLFIFVFFFKDKIIFKKLFIWYFLIWISYFLYHSSLIITLFENYQLSNRYLFEERFNKDPFKFNLINPLYILFVIIIYSISKNKTLNIIVSILIILIPEIINLLFIQGNFIISRIGYSSPLLLTFLMIFNLKKFYINKNSLKSLRNHKNFLFLLSYVFLFFVILTNSIIFRSSYNLMVPIVLFLYLILFYNLKNFIKLFTLGIIIFLFKFTSILNEGYKTGFLYVDNFNYPEPKENYRIVSLNHHCFETLFNSSQVLIKGHKTLDGNSVFYPINFAKKIQKIKEGNETCKEVNKFKYWNNRIFFTHGEFLKNKDLLEFFISNNVRIIRSRNKIKNDNLIFLGEFNFYNTSFVRYKLNESDFFKSIIDEYINDFENKIVNVYVYEIKNWKRIPSPNSNQQDKYLRLKIYNFYIFIFFIIIIIIFKIFKQSYLKRL